MIKGIDISHYQGTINFDQLKSAVDFVVIKADSGCPDPGQSPAQYKDSMFDRNRSEARRVGLACGFYHFSYPNIAGNTPEKEAQCFIDNIDGPQVSEFLVLDFEEPLATSLVVDWCKRFLDSVFLATTVRPMIYLNQSQVKQYNWSSVINAGYGLWLAHYDNAPDAPMDSWTPWPFVAMKQYFDAVSVPGVANPCDGDVFYGSVDGLKKYGFQPYSPAPQPAPPTPPTPPQPQPPVPDPVPPVPDPAPPVPPQPLPDPLPTPAPVPVPVPPPTFWQRFINWLIDWLGKL